MNILQEFYILFRSDADKAQKETAALEHGAEAAAVAVDALATAHGVAADAAAAAATIQTGAIAEVSVAEAGLAASMFQTGAAAAEAGAAAVGAHEAAAGAAGVELAAEEALGEAYVFNRMQRQELIGLARHSFDQLASGGSLMRVVASHAATLAEALGSGEGGLAAGFNALGSAALRFVGRFGLPIAAIAGAVALIGTAKGAVKDLEADRLMAGRVNMDVSDLDALRKTVRALGGDTKETDRDLERFANRVDDALGGKALEGGKSDRITKTLAGIGVHVRNANGQLKDTKALLLDVAGALEGKTKAQQSEALRALGFSSPRHGQTDPAMEKLLTGGREAMQRYIDTEKAMGGVTKEQVEAARRFKLETGILGERFRDLRNTLAQYVLPILTDLARAFRDLIEWLRLNKTLVAGFGVAFVGMATVVTAVIWGRLIPAFAALAVRVLLATWPIILIGAAVIGLAAIFAAAYEDVMFFLKGQPSLLGELVNKYEWVRKTVNFIGDAFKWVGHESAALWRGIVGGVKEAGGHFGWLMAILRPIGHLIMDIAHALGPALRAAGEIGLKALILPFQIVWQVAKGVWGVITEIAHALGPVLSAAAHIIGPVIKDMFDGWLRQLYLLIEGFRKLAHLKPDAQVEAFLHPAPPPAVKPAQSAIAAATKSPLAATTSAHFAHQAAALSKSYSIKVDKVEIKTEAKDPDGIAKAISGSLSTELRRAVSAFDDGVAR